MKPHEEEWTALHGIVLDAKLVVRAKCQFDTDARTMAAAPAMARALLSVLEAEADSDLRFTLGKGRIKAICLALQKAGALP